MTADAFAKRLRRHVVGRVRPYLAVTAPGLQDICAAELAGLASTITDIRVQPAGVAFNGRLQDCWLANLHVRTAARILMRIADFKATAFHQLQTKMAAVPWDLFLPAGPPAAVRAVVHGCRLFHSQAVVQRAAAAIHAQQDPTAGREAPPATVYLRGCNDRFTVSLDSSGAHLHRRGLKTHGGPAPLRETLAAAVLLAAGYRPGMALVDPMCGSGTFSLEAAMMGLGIPAGWFREFAFMRWPSFEPRRWEYLRRMARQPLAAHLPPTVFSSDIDAPACERLHGCIAAHGLEGFVQVRQADFFTLHPPAAAGLVVLNPPYGRRIGDPAAVARLYRDLWQRLARVWKGWRLAMIGPPHCLAAVSAAGFKTRSFTHGGLDLSLLAGTIPQGSSVTFPFAFQR
jgi:putative N6-adenine-specific DNA methylase